MKKKEEFVRVHFVREIGKVGERNQMKSRHKG